MPREAGRKEIETLFFLCHLCGRRCLMHAMLSHFLILSWDWGGKERLDCISCLVFIICGLRGGGRRMDGEWDGIGWIG